MKRTWEIIAELLTANIKTVLALAFGVTSDTVGAWARAKESDEYPTGTGKRNPLDQTERYIRIAHRYDPGNARSAANYFISLVNDLDRQAGIESAQATGSPCLLLAESAKEHTDVVVVLAGRPNDPEAWKTARTEIPQAISKLTELDGCLEKLLSREEEK
jgi:hypothetical protein